MEIVHRIRNKYYVTFPFVFVTLYIFLFFDIKINHLKENSMNMEPAQILLLFFSLGEQATCLNTVKSDLFQRVVHNSAPLLLHFSIYLSIDLSIYRSIYVFIYPSIYQGSRPC